MICDSFEESKIKEAELIIFHESYKKEKGYNMCIDAARGIEFLAEESLQRQAVKIHKGGFSFAKKKSEDGLVGMSRPHKTSKSWRIPVRFNKKLFSFSFEDKIEAAEFYDKYSVFRYGENACLNFPEKYQEYESIDFIDIINNKLQSPVARQRKTNTTPGIFYRKNHQRWGFSVVDPFSKKRHIEETFLSKEDAVEAQQEFLEINDSYKLPSRGKIIEPLIPKEEHGTMDSNYIEAIKKYRKEKEKYTGKIEDIKLSAEQLKKEIWEKSLKVVAANYRMTPHFLKNHCISQDIILPPKGFHMKIRNSKL